MGMTIPTTADAQRPREPLHNCEFEAPGPGERASFVPNSRRRLTMNRLFALLLALVMASITVSSACVAQSSEWVHFTLEPERSGADEIRVSFRDESRGREENNWSTGFHPSELVGLDPAGFRGAGTRPLHFAMIREAGRL